VDVHSLERWSTNPKLALVHRDKLVRSKLIHVYLNSTVVDLEVDDASNSITSAVVAAADGRISICAKKFIVAAGGVETTRLLLAVQRKHAGLFGGVNGPLGRYYMGHLSGKIANVVFNDPASVSAFDYELDSDGVYTRRRLTLTSALPLRARWSTILTSCAAALI